ncbi:uncharacterized protein EI90DRAFT_3067039 [Cantharellus anzutake]|uniref:uncharacterized protein n=1 Tax=Cantharellus anzutake TaxID=1750568 RepID=UPI001906686E|nr:uncharacterized protein EI90DRAFT_3067039 [Cantharellus anzutake]KAF8327796.1 hypothetical protein EI90DRAFT_3067039 [Cantharellus anzutake]
MGGECCHGWVLCVGTLRPSGWRVDSKEGPSSGIRAMWVSCLLGPSWKAIVFLSVKSTLGKGEKNHEYTFGLPLD